MNRMKLGEHQTLGEPVVPEPASPAFAGDREEVAARLGLAAPAAIPAAGLKTRLLDRIRKPRPLPGFSEDVPGFQVLRSGDGTWHPTPHAGIDVKLLSKDPSSDVITYLMRMAPGSTYPQHVHSREEQCWVLEGDVAHLEGRVRMFAGDFIRALPGTKHTSITSEGGCTLLIVGSRNDRARD